MKVGDRVVINKKRYTSIFDVEIYGGFNTIFTVIKIAVEYSSKKQIVELDRHFVIILNHL